MLNPRNADLWLSPVASSHPQELSITGGCVPARTCQLPWAMPASGHPKELLLQLTTTSDANADHIPHSWQREGSKETQVSQVWNVNTQYPKHCQAARALGTGTSLLPGSWDPSIAKVRNHKRKPQRGCLVVWITKITEVKTVIIVSVSTWSLGVVNKSWQPTPVLPTNTGRSRPVQTITLSTGMVKSMVKPNGQACSQWCSLKGAQGPILQGSTHRAQSTEPAEPHPLSWERESCQDRAGLLWLRLGGLPGRGFLWMGCWGGWDGAQSTAVTGWKMRTWRCLCCN